MYWIGDKCLIHHPDDPVLIEARIVALTANHVKVQIRHDWRGLWRKRTWWMEKEHVISSDVAYRIPIGSLI